MMMPMANDLTNPNEELLALRRNAARYRIGELPGERIAFKKGAWLRGTRKLPIPEDERFVVALLESLHGWLKWKNQRPQFVLGRVSDPSWVPPDRDELGDLNAGDWPTGLDGQIADPWRRIVILIMGQEITREVFHTMTSSKTGLTAFWSFLDSAAAAANDRLPVVQLDSKDLSTRYGTIPIPDIKIVSWIGGSTPTF